MKANHKLGTYIRRLVFALLILGLTPTLTLAQPSADTAPPSDAATRGLEIVVEADRRDTGFGDLTAGMIMILRNRHGEESTREIRNRTKEVDGDGDKTLIIFDDPRDIKGTAFLNYPHAVGPDEQWLYLPALKRVKRIASNNKSGPFMGSEFAYEDISSQEVEKYSYTYLRDEVLDGVDHFVIERYPVDENSGYTRQVSWVDQDEYRVWKVEYYDRKNSHLKTLTVPSHQQYLGKHWRADEMRMVNHLTGKSTRLIWQNYSFGADLDDSDFTKVSLKRVR